jgi:predicted nucleic acid-binding Zn ribbon protein
MRRRAPEPFADALRDAVGEVTPDTLLARVQALWPELAGAAIAAHATPSAEGRGVVSIECDSSAYAYELGLMEADFVASLNRRIQGFELLGLRFIVKTP